MIALEDNLELLLIPIETRIMRPLSYSVES